MQVRTSYIPNEICWGERLVPLLTFQLQNGRYEIDYGNFHSTVPLKMPQHSAKKAAEVASLQGTPTEHLDRDYPMSFTALPPSGGVYRKRPVSEMFTKRHRITASEGKGTDTKRKIASARDRSRTDNYKGSTVTLADPTRIPAENRRPFKTLFQQTSNDESQSKKFALFSFRSSSEKSGGSTERPRTADATMMLAASWGDGDGSTRRPSVGSIELEPGERSEQISNVGDRTDDGGNEIIKSRNDDGESDDTLDDIEESHEEAASRFYVTPTTIEGGSRDDIISSSSAVQERRQSPVSKKPTEFENVDGRSLDLQQRIVTDQSSL